MESMNENTSEMLATGFLNLYEDHLIGVKQNLKELIAKQNKIYIDLSTEKHIYSDNNVFAVIDMMEKIKLYKEKLVNIKKQMTQIHQRTKMLQKKAVHIQTCKEKELIAKRLKQQQEESLIGK